MTDLTMKIDRLAEIKRLQEALKKEKDKLEAEIIKQCSEDLANTKYKTVHYGGNNSELTAVNAESLKVTYDAFLPYIFGKAYENAVTEKKTYTLSKPATRMLIGLWKGDYIRSTVKDVIRQMNGITEADRKQLFKNCRGINYDKDVDNILKFTKLSKQDAREYAYLIYEAAVWEEFMSLCKLNGITDPIITDDLLIKIRSAFVVEESTKISLAVNDND